MTMQKPTFQGEIMLAGWQESHTAGAKVTFWLPDSESLEVFKGMTAKKGNTAGQRFMAVLVEIGEDELPVANQEGKPKGGELARLAGMWCQEIQFYEFIRPVYDKYMGGDGSGTGDIEPDNGDVESYCRHCILVMCEVETRADLDHNHYAAKAFHELIRIPYSEWLKKHGG